MDVNRGQVQVLDARAWARAIEERNAPRACEHTGNRLINVRIAEGAMSDCVACRRPMTGFAYQCRGCRARLCRRCRQRLAR